MTDIQTHFTKIVDDYDTVADNVVFMNDELHEQLVSAIDADAQKSLNILDLGCGTGHGMKLIAERFPYAHITGIDFSPTMIERARKNLATFSDRIALLEVDFNKHSFDCGYDAVVSAIAIHNASHEQKERLFQKIFDSLLPRGLFINADFYEHESSVVDEGFKRIYRTFLEKNLSDGELEAWLHHAFHEDMPMSLEKQSALLSRAGFADFQLLWTYNNEAVYRLRK